MARIMIGSLDLEMSLRSWEIDGCACMDWETLWSRKGIDLVYLTTQLKLDVCMHELICRGSFLVSVCAPLSPPVCMAGLPLELEATGPKL